MKNRFGDYIVYIKIVPGLVDGVGGWVKLIMAKPAFSLQLLREPVKNVLAEFVR